MIWAAAYRLVGILPRRQFRRSLLAECDDGLRTRESGFGKTLQLMGALEALNGTLLFGLTTAFLFGITHRIWELQGSRSH